MLAQCAAYRTVMHPDTFFSHATAAAIHGLPVPDRAHRGGIHVSAVLPARAPKGGGVIGHALRSRPGMRTVRSFPVPSPAEVWCQLAASLSTDELVIAGDALMRRIQPLCDPAELMDIVAGASGRPGIRRLREALELVRPRTDSPMETVLRLGIVRAGLPEPIVNHPIADPTGRICASGDLVFPDQRVVVEYDGDHHRTDPAQYQTDLDRLFLIESLGWRVVRISKEHMRAGATVAIARVRSALASNGPDTPSRTHP
ncbi:endonuclease domain-containing protein [Leifsonia xyli]|uniref:endonuclease domain-containing protein n=1 Tax=Leifsonia xyli TaxID=1575 RepID=UPI003D67428A